MSEPETGAAEIIAAPVSEAAALASEAVQQSAETAAQLQNVEAAAEQVAEEIEDEFAWLREKLALQETELKTLGAALVDLPSTITNAIREGLSGLIQQPQQTPTETPAAEPETVSPEAMQENPAVPVVVEPQAGRKQVFL